MSDLRSLRSVQVALKQLEFDRWLEAHGKTKRKDLTRKQELELKECFDLIDSGASGTHFPFTDCCSLPSVLGYVSPQHMDLLNSCDLNWGTVQLQE